MGEIVVKKEIVQIITQIINKQKKVNFEKEELLNKLQEFVNKKLYPILLDDHVISSEEQVIILNVIHSLIEELKVFLLYPWLNGKIKVAFAGKFSSGKSSIVNTLLGKNVLPTDITHTTVLPTYITLTPYSEYDILVIDNEGAIIPLERSFLQLFKHSNLDDFIGAILQKMIDYIILNEPVELVKNVIIIDTPGYNPGTTTNIDRELSMRVLQESDIIFWTVDINDGGMSGDSLEIIKKYELDKNEKEFYIILNKAELKPPSARKRICDSIRKSIQTQNINCKDILFFSSRNKELAEIEKIIKIIKNYSSKPRGVDILFERLKEFLEDLQDEIMEKQKSLIKEKDEKKQRMNKIINSEFYFKDTIRYFIKKSFLEFAKYEKPWFDDNYYKIYEKNLENFCEAVSQEIGKFIREIQRSIFLGDERGVNQIRTKFIRNKFINFIETQQAINVYQKRIEDIRKAIRELEEIEKEFKLKLSYIKI